MRPAGGIAINHNPGILKLSRVKGFDEPVASCIRIVAPERGFGDGLQRVRECLSRHPTHRAVVKIGPEVNIGADGYRAIPNMHLLIELETVQRKKRDKLAENPAFNELKIMALGV